MTINLSVELAAAIVEEARKRNIAPEMLVQSILSEHLAGQRPLLPIPQDDWELQLLSAARDYGVSLSNEAVSSDGIYD